MTSRSRTSELIEAGEARELLRANLGSDPYDLLEKLNEAGARRAKAEGVAYELEQERKVVLARVASEIARSDSSSSMSEAKLERLARADPRYTEHLKGVAAAIEERELARNEYWAVRSELEWDRAAIAHYNALTRLDEG